MNILFLSKSRGKICGFNLAKPLHMVLMTGLLGVMMAGSAFVGYQLNPGQDSQALINEWQDDVRQHKIELAHIREEADADIDAMSSRIGLLQAHVMRLDALGQKLVKMASIDKTEFDFDSPPALGGPETVNDHVFAAGCRAFQAIEQLQGRCRVTIGVVGVGL